MGIQGLLPQLRDITENSHIRDFKNKTVGVDGYVWLHRGIITCSTQICLQRPTDGYARFFIRRVKLLQKHGVIPYIVFDGGPLPQKKGKEQERLEKREKNFKAGQAFYDQGLTSKAEECFRKAVDITPTMAYQVIKILKKMGIQYVVAPYEADAQLAYLFRQKKIDAVLSEDGDLLTYGCEVLLCKFESNGACQKIDLTKLHKNQIMRFGNWTKKMFVVMCIFSGCDYLSFKGIGIKGAHKLVVKYRSNYKRAIQSIKMNTNKVVPNNYARDFERAWLTFQHQTVFCPDLRKLVHLHFVESESTEESFDFVGPLYDNSLAKKVAKGEVHPETKRPISEHELEEPYIVINSDNVDRMKVANKNKRQNSAGGLNRQTSIFSFFQRKKPKPKPESESESEPDLTQQSSLSLSQPTKASQTHIRLRIPKRKPKPNISTNSLDSFSQTNSKDSSSRKQSGRQLKRVRGSVAEPLKKKVKSKKRKRSPNSSQPRNLKRSKPNSKFFDRERTPLESNELFPADLKELQKKLPHYAAPNSSLTAAETLRNFNHLENALDKREFGGSEPPSLSALDSLANHSSSTRKPFVAPKMLGSSRPRKPGKSRKPVKPRKPGKSRKRPRKPGKSRKPVKPFGPLKKQKTSSLQDLDVLRKAPSPVGSSVITCKSFQKIEHELKAATSKDSSAKPGDDFKLNDLEGFSRSRVSTASSNEIKSFHHETRESEKNNSLDQFAFSEGSQFNLYDD